MAENVETTQETTDNPPPDQTIPLAQYQALQRKWEDLRKQASAVMSGRAQEMVQVVGKLDRLEMGLAELAEVVGGSLQTGDSNPLAPLKSKLAEHRDRTDAMAKAFGAAQAFAFANDVDAESDERLAAYRDAMEKKDYAAAFDAVQGAIKAMGAEPEEARVKRLVAEQLRALGKVDTGTTTSPPSKKPSLAELGQMDVGKMSPAARRAHEKNLWEALESTTGVKPNK